MTRIRYRSDEAAEYRKLYKTKAWNDLRLTIIKRDKFKCQHCDTFVTKGKKSPRSAVVHHKEAHKGNLGLFYDPNNLELTCKSCHDGDLQSTEARGYSTKMGDDGWPVDAKHPVNREAQSSNVVTKANIPAFDEPTVPVILVCGAPCSGKTTYAQEHSIDGDVIVDLDDFKELVGGRRWDTSFAITKAAIHQRDAMLASLHKRQSGSVFVIISGRTHDERDQWSKALGDAEILVLDTSMAECIRRVRADKSRAHAVKQLIDSIVKWFDVSHKANRS